VVRDLRALRDLASDANGAQRVAWSPAWQRARDWLRGLVRDLPVAVDVDAASNVWITLAGTRDRSLVIGSHLDSVPSGGWLDGPLGVLAGVEVIRRLAAAGKPDVTVHVVDWADEEGVAFGLDHIGASAWTGIVDAAALDRLVSRDGEPFAAIAPRYGFDFARLEQCRARLGHVGAYLELHIEQGPVLERLGQPLAAVTGTVGVERHRVRFAGVATHAGSTPMPDRHDAAVAAARFVVAAQDIARRTPGSVATTGSIVAAPGVATVIAGTCDVTVDLRHPEADTVAAMLAEMRAASAEAAAAEGVDVRWEPRWRIEPTLFDPALIDLCTEAIAEVTGAGAHRMASGALHDAAVVARAGIPAVMLFVQSRAGLSHTVAEDTDEAQLEVAVRALDALATRTIDWLSRVVTG
jgi:N-carbamoyl-L-amino-acid hydrolase